MKSTEKCENWLSDYRQKANIKPTLVYEGGKGANTVMHYTFLTCGTTRISLADGCKVNYCDVEAI